MLNEPRFKFYVKDGRRYTLPTGVPWVWPDVVRQIQRQTAEEAAGKAGKLGKGKVVEVKPQVEVERKKVALKRQTARPVR